MSDTVGVIAMIAFGVLGIIMMTAPQVLTREDKRDDPEALAQVKKTGRVMIAFAVGAALLVLKYKLI